MFMLYHILVAALTSLFMMTTSFPIFAFLSMMQFLQVINKWLEALHSNV